MADEVGDAVRKRIGLARPGACDDEQGAGVGRTLTGAMRCRIALLRVELGLWIVWGWRRFGVLHFKSVPCILIQ